MSTRQDVTPDDAQDLRARFEGAAPVITVDPAPVVRRGRRHRVVTRSGGALGAVAAVAVAVMLLTRLGGDGPGPATTTPPPPEEPRPVSILVAPAVVAPGGVVTAALVANEQNNLMFGVEAEVERWNGREWRPTGAAHMCLSEWSCIGKVTDRLDAVETIGLSAPVGRLGAETALSTEGLVDGWYRLIHRASGGRFATGVFEVRTGAPAAPPQPDRDDVRLSLDPVLVPPEGGLARVTTLVPANTDGTLTAEDIEAVDAGLDPTARIERWDGARWLEVAEVPVLEPDVEGAEWDHPFPLPPHDEGAYRVFRGGAGDAEAWGVFAVVNGAPELP